jgi:hypothetical protein
LVPFLSIPVYSICSSLFDLILAQWHLGVLLRRSIQQLYTEYLLKTGFPQDPVLPS